MNNENEEISGENDSLSDYGEEEEEEEGESDDEGSFKIEIKLWSGKSLFIRIDETETLEDLIRSLKEEKRYGEEKLEDYDLGSSDFYFRGRIISEKGVKLSEHGVNKESELYLVKKFFYTWNFEGILYPVMNFRYLKEKRRKKLMNRKFVENRIKQSKENSDFQKVLDCGFYGPLVKILEKIDPIELLMNFLPVNTEFQKTVFYMFEKKMIIMNSSHLHCLIIDSYDNDLLCKRLLRLGSIDYDNLKVRSKFLSYGFLNSDLSVFNSLVKNFYLESAKFMLKTLNFKPPPNALKLCCAQSGSGEDDTKELRKRGILECIIANCEGFNLSKQVFFALERNNMEKSISLLMMKKNFKKEEFYKYFFDENRTPALSKFLEMKEYYTFDFDKIDWGYVDSFGRIEKGKLLKRLDWKLMEAMLTGEVKSMYSSCILKELCNKEELKKYLACVKEENTILTFYKPRFLLYAACLSNDEGKVNECLEKYNPNYDIHIDVFDFSLWNLSPEIAKLILEKVSFKVTFVTYCRALKEKRFDLADLLGDHFFRNCNYWKYSSSYHRRVRADMIVELIEHRVSDIAFKYLKICRFVPEEKDNVTKIFASAYLNEEEKIYMFIIEIFKDNFPYALYETVFQKFDEKLGLLLLENQEKTLRKKTIRMIFQCLAKGKLFTCGQVLLKKKWWKNRYIKKLLLMNQKKLKIITFLRKLSFDGKKLERFVLICARCSGRVNVLRENLTELYGDGYCDNCMN